MPSTKLHITCPNCHTQISLDEVLTHQIEQQVQSVEKEKHQKELEIARGQANEKLIQELKLSQDESAQKSKQLDEVRNQELELRKQKNILEDQKKSFELEKQRQLDLEREKIRKSTTDEILQQQRLKEKEKDKVITDLKKSLEDAQRKANQGSQQLQGEVQELDIEMTLHLAFPEDAIEPVAKGELGADIKQVVKSPKGALCGTILWESKRTKQWSDGWIAKLKSDQLTAKAHVIAIISEALPEEAKTGIGLKNGVWVASPKLLIPLSMLLRKSLLDATYQKIVSNNRQNKASLLYSYITGHEFQQQVESLIETYKEMQQQIVKERVAFEKSWKQRETQVNRLILGTAGLYGSIAGIAGPTLPGIKSLELGDGVKE